MVTTGGADEHFATIWFGDSRHYGQTLRKHLHSTGTLLRVTLLLVLVWKTQICDGSSEIRLKSRAEELDTRTMTERETSRMAQG